MKTITTMTFALACVLGVACSSSSGGSTGSSDSGGQNADTATSADTGDRDVGTDSSGSDVATDADETAASKPVTPSIVDVTQMSGALHVSWKLNDTGLDNVLLWRNKDGGTYAIAYTLPGTATSQHDMSAMAPGTFCYKVQTKRAGTTSDQSAEKCGTP